MPSRSARREPSSWQSAGRGGRGVVTILIVAVVTTLVAALLYIGALRNADTRAEVTRLDRAADAGRADVAALRRDYEIRSRMNELERWSGSLDLAAPGADQYARRPDAITAAAVAREKTLQLKNGTARPAPTYPPAARDQLDDLVGTVASH